MKPRLTGFPAAADGPVRVLILGSMPGQASLDAGRYYAHPRNSFWKILGDCLGFDAGADYVVRLRTLNDHGIALWDVLQACTRKGSLDADIDAASMEPNDFAAFFEEHPGLQSVCFNGATAQRVFRQKVLPVLERRPELPQPVYRNLPSTSPAHAAMAYETKLALWREALGI